MKTVGELLKEARLKKRLSLHNVERGTKIKKEFVEAIEKGNWKSLPDFSVVSGFVKNLASYLGIDAKVAFSVLKRDYPPQKLFINPKPDVENKFIWTPKYTFLAGIIIVVLAVFGYLGFQYFRFNAAPELIVSDPKDGFVATTNQIEVDGKTDPDATIKVNNQTVLVDSSGNFSTKLDIFEGTKEIDVIAISRSGKETIIKRKIIPQL